MHHHFAFTCWDRCLHTHSFLSIQVYNFSSIVVHGTRKKLSSTGQLEKKYQRYNKQYDRAHHSTNCRSSEASSFSRILPIVIPKIQNCGKVPHERENKSQKERKPSYPTTKAREWLVKSSQLGVIGISNKGILSFLLVLRICCLTFKHWMVSSRRPQKIKMLIRYWLHQFKVRS